MNAVSSIPADRAAVYLARARFGIGLVLLAAPRLAGRSWVGGAADSVGARVFARATGIREAALGAGASIAIGQKQGGGDWISMCAVADLGDAAVSLLTPGLPARARLVGIVAGASAVVHLKLAKDLAAAEAEPA